MSLPPAPRACTKWDAAAQIAQSTARCLAPDMCGLTGGLLSGAAIRPIATPRFCKEDDVRWTRQPGCSIDNGSALKIRPSLGAEFTTQENISTCRRFYFNL